MSSELLETKSDGNLLGLVDRCEKYATLQSALAKKLSAGIFQLAQARKHGKMTLSADDISREDFDARMFIDASSGNSGSAKTSPMDDETQTAVEVGDRMESLMMFSALPPPALRRAQELFVEAVQIAATMATNVREIDGLLQQ
jgi:hypothetical protein